MERWRHSAERARLLQELDAHSLRELCTLDRRVARIIVPSDASGPKWKLLVASWVVSFPLLLILVQLIDRVAPGSPLLLRVALTSILMSVAITWVISPVVMRWTRSWRLGNQQMRVDVAESLGA